MLRNACRGDEYEIRASLRGKSGGRHLEQLIGLVVAGDRVKARVGAGLAEDIVVEAG